MTPVPCACTVPSLALMAGISATASPGEWAGLAPAVFLAVLVAIALWRVVLRVVIAVMITVLVVGLLLLGTHLGPADGSVSGRSSTSDGSGR